MNTPFRPRDPKKIVSSPPERPKVGSKRRSPTVSRRGFLPIATTRGDRLFVGLLSAAWLNLAFVAVSEKMMGWFSLEQEPSVWFSFVASMALLAFVMRKG